MVVEEYSLSGQNIVLLVAFNLSRWSFYKTKSTGFYFADEFLVRHHADKRINLLWLISSLSLEEEWCILIKTEKMDDPSVLRGQII